MAALQEVKVIQAYISYGCIYSFSTRCDKTWHRLPGLLLSWDRLSPDTPEQLFTKKELRTVKLKCYLNWCTVKCTVDPDTGNWDLTVLSRSTEIIKFHPSRSCGLTLGGYLAGPVTHVSQFTFLTSGTDLFVKTKIDNCQAKSKFQYPCPNQPKVPTLTLKFRKQVSKSNPECMF